MPTTAGCRLSRPARLWCREAEAALFETMFNDAKVEPRPVLLRLLLFVSGSASRLSVSASACVRCGLQVALTPGRACNAHSPGYFRLCYAFVSKPVLQVAIRRLAAVWASHSRRSVRS
jgi:hypothetical protein